MSTGEKSISARQVRSTKPVKKHRPPRATTSNPDFGSSKPAAPESQSYTLDDLSKLIELLHPAISKWRIIGTHLKVDVELIHANNPGDVQECFREMLKRRLQQEPLPRSELYKVLCMRSVGHKDLADKYFCEETFTSPDNKESGDISKSNVLHCIVPDISTVFPYTRFRRRYNFTAFFFAVFIILQLLIIFDNHEWVMPRNLTMQQYTNRVVFFILYTVLMIATPSVCFVQLRTLGKLEETYAKSDNSIKLLVDNTTKDKVDDILSERKLSLYPLELKDQLLSIVKLNLNEVDIKRFQVLMHAIILPLFLYIVQAFNDSKTDQTGWKNLRIGGERVIEIWEAISFVIIFLLTGTVKDLYCFENHLATVLVENESNRNAVQSKEVFHAVRKRWIYMDSYTHVLAVIFTGLAIVSLLYGEPFTPRYLTQENVIEQHTWNIVTILVILLQFGGSSANPVFKLLCVINYLMILLTMGTVVFLDELNIHLPRGNALLLIFTTQLVTLINWLICLFHCYWRQDKLKTLRYHLCLAAVILVIGCLCFINIREFKYYIHERNCTCTCANGTVYRYA